MCHYCGCREIPLIKEFIAEHEAVTNAAGDALRALDSGDPARARDLVTEMTAVLLAHWKGEEDGLFTVMERDPEYAPYIAALVEEHRELAAFLSGADLADPADTAALRRAVQELHHHIAKEEDGLFPASLTALTGDDWDLSIQAWRTAHLDGNLRPAG
ncbi:hemerythrin domain-containing protein [Streptomyces sp. H34-S4]|uniref:hemerythrin domain-containing protein n=1 Tax=Streptomyces sp. H34-S4 TaxID=2996463 RepID=UPI002271760B|nr:hemerythrin domain-containing protein [Streptomyces sp. H34-S4]MCY0934119.1 hemerythrin domain-containing protein [Streptomyces sp. H34-S4]